MGYLYHRVQSNMTGETLYPLNQLRTRHPEAYAEHVTKYEGRETLRERRIPALDCLWNDVLQFSPVHPKAVKKAFESLGHGFRSRRFYRIPAELLPPKDTLIYLYRKELVLPGFLDVHPDNWEPYDPNGLDRHAELLPETLEYFKERFDAGQRPMPWIYVPHILYRGTLDTRELEIIEV